MEEMQHKGESLDKLVSFFRKTRKKKDRLQGIRADLNNHNNHKRKAKALRRTRRRQASRSHRKNRG